MNIGEMNDRQQKYYNDILNITQQKGWQVLSDRYERMDNKMEFKCENGHVWNTQARYVLEGRSCKQCIGKTLEQGKQRFIKKVQEKEGIIIGEYCGHHTKVLIQCKFEHKWEVTPLNIYAGNWCTSCYENRTIGVAKDKFFKVVEQRGGKVLGKYVCTRTKIQVQCEFGHIWEVKPTNVITRTWCPDCRESRGEYAVKLYLLQNNIPYIQQGVIANLPRKRFDFIIQYKNENIVIEYDGEQHFQYVELFHKTKEEFKYRQSVDRVKTAIALNSGYKIIRIDYSQLKNIKYHLDRALSRLDIIYISTHKLYDGWLLGQNISLEEYLFVK